MAPSIDGYGRAVAAYAHAARIDDAPDAQQAYAASGSTGSFAAMVKTALQDGIAAGKATEQASAAAVTGGGDISHIVTAVAEAETTLQTMVAIRDRVVEAYKDILRMPI
jgi:flagellar hook-basal body complex protein FliE